MPDYGMPGQSRSGGATLRRGQGNRDEEDDVLTATTPEVRDARPNRTRAMFAAGGAAAAAVAWSIEVPLGGARLSVSFGGAHPQTVVAGEVVGAAIVAGLLGWLLLAVLEWLTPDSRIVWTSLAVIVLAASLVLPVTAATTPSAAVNLVVLHLVVAGVVIPGMALTTRRPDRA
jgi:hypothetical protein